MKTFLDFIGGMGTLIVCCVVLVATMIILLRCRCRSQCGCSSAGRIWQAEQTAQAQIKETKQMSEKFAGIRNNKAEKIAEVRFEQPAFKKSEDKVTPKKSAAKSASEKTALKVTSRSVTSTASKKPAAKSVTKKPVVKETPKPALVKAKAFTVIEKPESGAALIIEKKPEMTRVTAVAARQSQETKTSADATRSEVTQTAELRAAQLEIKNSAQGKETKSAAVLMSSSSEASSTEQRMAALSQRLGAIRQTITTAETTNSQIETQLVKEAVSENVAITDKPAIKTITADNPRRITFKPVKEIQKRPGKYDEDEVKNALAGLTRTIISHRNEEE